MQQETNNNSLSFPFNSPLLELTTFDSIRRKEERKKEACLCVCAVISLYKTFCLAELLSDGGKSGRPEKRFVITQHTHGYLYCKSVRTYGRTVEQTSMQLLLTEAGDQVSRESLYQRKHFVQQQQPQRTYGRAGGRRATSITSGRISID